MGRLVCTLCDTSHIYIRPGRRSLQETKMLDTMKKNMGKIDQRIRLVIGLLAVAAGIYFKSWWGALGIIFIVTALVNWCPLYLPFGISTRKK